MITPGRVLTTLVVMGLLVLAFAGFGFRINATPSMPLGFYRVVSGVPERGSLVSYSLPQRSFFGVLAARRGYTGANHPHPLLKRVVAVAGDQVQVTPQGVRVNGRLQPCSRIRHRDRQGRPMPSVLRSGRVPNDYALLMAPHPGSFDGRYFGFVPTARLTRVVSLLTFSQEVSMTNFYAVDSDYLGYLKAAADQVDADASENPGAAIEVDPDVAEFMGAFEETGLSLEEALDAAALHQIV